MVHRFASLIVFGNLINLKNYENKYVANVLSEFFQHLLHCSTFFDPEMLQTIFCKL